MKLFVPQSRIDIVNIFLVFIKRKKRIFTTIGRSDVVSTL